jgi:adenine-specific DNA methylase
MSDRRKRLGAFYTPPEMAAKLVDWAIRSPEDRVIDPSLGGFVFLRLAKRRLLSLGDRRKQSPGLVYGIDMDEQAVRTAREEAGLDDATLIHSDFFAVDPASLPTFAANIGNPPYVRYQSWARTRSPAHAIAEAMGVKLTKLSSTWAPFILHGCRFLEQGGRMAQVLPAELLHAQYAAPVVKYLERAFRAVTVAVFEERVFPDALEEVVLLFAEGFGEGPAGGVAIMPVGDLDHLQLPKIDGRGRGYLSPETPLLPLLPTRTQALYRKLMRDRRVRGLGQLASVDIGAVTGANAFFLRTRSEIESREFDRSLFKTAICKASDVAGARLTRADIDRLVSSGRATELLATNGHSRKRLASIRPLLAEGERDGLHKRYKCRVRSPWWAVPLPIGRVPDLFLTYMSNVAPRLVRNEAGAVSTNTVHQVTMAPGVSAKALSVAFYNSLTLLSAELVGRSYGGGILKLEPTESERVLVPEFDFSVGKRLPTIDRLLRCGDLSTVVEAIDPLVLSPLGLDDADIARLRSARQQLLARRRARNGNR